MPPDNAPNRCDPLLLPLLAVSNQAQVDCQLRMLIDVAQPIVTGIVQYKMRTVLPAMGASDMLQPTRMRLKAYESPEEQDAENIRSDALASITKVLRRIADDRKTEIRDFGGYVAAVTYRTFRECLQEQQPERAKIEGQLRRLLTELPEYALWDHVPGNAVSECDGRRIKRLRLCGFETWKRQKTGLQETEKLALLRNKPQNLALLLSRDGDLNELPLPQLLETIFGWLGQPVGFQDLVTAVARLSGVKEHALQLIPRRDGQDDPLARIHDQGLSPEDEIIQRDHLRRLWNVMCGLSPRQAAVILLDRKTSGMFLQLFPALGIATRQEIAQLMDMDITTLADLWDKLPLMDKQIAANLRISAEQVAQMRRRAEQKLETQMLDSEI